jgi:6-phosphogluconolactonase
MPPPDVQVLPTAAALMEMAAQRVVSAAAAAIRASGRFVVALAGGSTPKTLYTLLATEVYTTRLEWQRVQIFWGDERCVGPDDPASNYRMVREALLDHVPVPAANVHRIHGEDAPARAAAAYERELRATFITPGGSFDLVLLGMGDNGHTASLFPGLAAVLETTRWVMAEYVDQVSAWRVTLTPVVINAAGEVLFLVSGRAKAPMLSRVLDGPRDPDALPAQAVAPRDGRLIWLVDAAAAANLERSTGSR